MLAQKHTHEEDNEQQKNENQDIPEGPDGSDSSSQENKDGDEYLAINLADIRKDVQCPICLGIIRKTRTVMECLHRFCKECIDKSIRLGNNECPACRTHCASRRSLRDDPNYDALIAAIYPDIDKYEEEEMALHDEEKTRNKELQDSIAQTLRRQTVAQGRKHTRSKSQATASLRRSQSNSRSVGMKRRQSYLYHELRGSDDSEDEEADNYSSSDEHCAEIGPKRSNTRIGIHFSHPSGSNASGDGDRHETDSEVDRECIGTTPALPKGSEKLTWGSSGLRSRVSSGKDTYKSRDSNLIDHLQNFTNDESGICLKLVPFDAHELPKLQQLHIRCRPILSVRQLCEYAAFQNALETNDIEIYLVQGLDPNLDLSTGGSFSFSDFKNIDPTKHKIQVVQEHETLAGIQSTCGSGRGPLILAYRKKLPNSGH